MNCSIENLGYDPPPRYSFAFNSTPQTMDEMASDGQKNGPTIIVTSSENEKGTKLLQ